MVRDRAMNSMSSIYKVTCKLSNEVMTFDLGWPWRVKIYKLTHISGMVRDNAMNSMGNIYKVTCELSNEVMTFDLGWPWKVKIQKFTYISGRVRDRAMNSMGSIYKVTCKLSNEVMTFNLDDLEGPNSTKWLISREWWEIRPWTQWATYIKLHVSFQMRSWPLTLNDL